MASTVYPGGTNGDAYVDDVETFIPLVSSQKDFSHHAQSIKKKPQPSGSVASGASGQNGENAEGDATDIDGGPGGHKRRFSMEELLKQGNALGHEIGWLIILQVLKLNTVRVDRAAIVVESYLVLPVSVGDDFLPPLLYICCCFCTLHKRIING